MKSFLDSNGVAFLLGKIKNWIPGAASESVSGTVKLLTSYTSTNTEKAATPKAVKQAYDAAVAHADGLTAADVGALPNTLLDVVQQSYSLSCAANTYTYSSALSGLSAGHTYLILARAEISVNGSGVHAVSINVNNSNLNQVRTTAQAGGGASTWAITTLPDSPQVKVRVHVPVACTASVSLAAIRIA